MRLKDLDDRLREYIQSTHSSLAGVLSLYCELETRYRPLNSRSYDGLL